MIFLWLRLQAMNNLTLRYEFLSSWAIAKPSCSARRFGPCFPRYVNEQPRQIVCRHAGREKAMRDEENGEVRLRELY